MLYKIILPLLHVIQSIFCSILLRKAFLTGLLSHFCIAHSCALVRVFQKALGQEPFLRTTVPKPCPEARAAPEFLAKLSVAAAPE